MVVGAPKVSVAHTAEPLHERGVRLARKGKRFLGRFGPVRQPHRLVERVGVLRRIGHAHRAAAVLAFEQRQQGQLPRGQMEEVVLHRPAARARQLEPVRAQLVDQRNKLAPPLVNRFDLSVGGGHDSFATFVASAITAS